MMAYGTLPQIFAQIWHPDLGANGGKQISKFKCRPYLVTKTFSVFDVVNFTSEQSYDGVLIILSCLTGEQTYSINAKTWYIEPTNHPENRLSKEEIKEWGERELGKYGDVEFLTFTDYILRNETKSINTFMKMFTNFCLTFFIRTLFLFQE